MLKFPDDERSIFQRRLERCERDTYRLGFWTGAILSCMVTTLIFAVFAIRLFLKTP